MKRHGVMVLCMTVIFVLSASIGVAQTESNESDESNLIIDVVLPIALAYIMFSLGIGLRISDFSSILDDPKAFAVGLTNQMVLLPIVAFTISHGLGLTGEMAVGLMILACCPGGVTSNIITRISGGAVSYTHLTLSTTPYV